MRRMSNKEYWNLIYNQKGVKQELCFLKRYAKIFMENFLGKKIFEYMNPYPDYLLWNVIYEKYMPKTKGLKVLEVGSAPGHHLVKLEQVFGFVPYGIEYSESGVELNRRIFISHGLNPDNVIYADFLSDELHKQYREYFDIVISRGFIEHFTEVKEIIDKHINLLKKGGYLFVSIPNLRGFNYFLTWMFSRKSIATHNIMIMQKDRFFELFDRRRLSTLFCGYFGTFDFPLYRSLIDLPIPFMRTFLETSR
ncbi:MAG: class I SAM-dependent methyltransferase, partial [candidate division Zixibacteria bacterium]|nr:class I SAM-dependent methyltransferase [candidate division Zixibacteria bacterium]